MKADTDDGWTKLANGLAEALAHAHMTEVQHAVCWWLVCASYGRKEREGKGLPEACRTASYSYNVVALQTGRDRKNVQRAIEDLLKAKVLKEKRAGEIRSLGFNTRLSDWRPGILSGYSIPMGVRKTGGWHGATQPMGYTAHGSGNPNLGARQPQTHGLGNPKHGAGQPQKTLDENVVRARGNEDVEEKKREDRGPGPRTPTLPGFLPNGKRDTMAARADLGHADLAPCDHPGWDRENFERRDQWQAEWQAEVDVAAAYRKSDETRARLRARGAMP